MANDRLTAAIGFAHRGARDRAPDNRLESFALALELGAGGLESDVWLTADGVPVLDHDGLVPRLDHQPRSYSAPLGARPSRAARKGADTPSRVRLGDRFRHRRPIGDCRRAELPPDIASLEDLYATCGDDFELSLDVLDPAAIGPVMAVAAAADATARLWLCHSRRDQLVAWRSKVGDARLVHSASRRRGADVAQQAAALNRARIDAVNLHVRQWRGPMVDAFHRQGLTTLAWDAQTGAALNRVLALGVDGVYSDHVEIMVAALADSYS